MNPAPVSSAASASLPLVTIVALAYNHEPYLPAALNSILAQDYPNLEVFLVDDASADGSAAIMRRYAAANPGWQTIFFEQNVGNCAAFNAAYRRSRGQYLIDLATDDQLLPGRVSRQVAVFEQLDARYGMLYSDAILVPDDGSAERPFYRRDAQGQPLPRPVTGEAFADVLGRFFICAPTMLMRRSTLDALGGYDETLAYEDFDFWVRASRDYWFYFLDEVTTRKTIHPRSKSAAAYRRHDPLLLSTLRTCRKALALCRTPAERAALGVRLRYELRHAVRNRHYPGTREALALLAELYLPAAPARWLRGLVGA